MLTRTTKLSFVAACLAGLAFFSPPAASAATVVTVLESGRLTITDASVALTGSSAMTADNLRLLNATFSLSVTDTTGTKAGWHIQATLGPLTGADGPPVPIHSATITEAHVATLTGRPPTSLLPYPRALRAGGDTIFSAAGGSGMGKSSLAFAVAIVVAADAADGAPLIGSAAMTIAAGP